MGIEEEQQISPEQPPETPTEEPIRIWPLAFAMGLGFFLALIWFSGNTGLGVDDPSIAKIREIQALVQTNYVEEVDPARFTDRLLQGGLSTALDPYSCYVDRKAVEQENARMAGEFGGIGIHLAAKANPKFQSYDMVIVSVIENTPAQKAGLRIGDIIVAVSSTTSLDSRVSVVSLSYSEILDMIRGKPGTKVKLWIFRGGQVKTFTLTREIIEVATVNFRKIQNNIGYVQLTEFIDATDSDFVWAVDTLVAGGAKVLIIDVRNNPGGLLDVVLSILTKFRANLDSPPIYTRGRNGQYEPCDFNWQLARELLGRMVFSRTMTGEDFKTMMTPYAGIKVVVLINEYSASASEILSGWFKEEYGAPIVGRTSFGKGCVQRQFKLSDGSQLWLTVENYFIGRNKIAVHKIGIKPTVEVANSGTGDAQLDKAIEIARSLLK